jgi:hypothetical protein
VTPDEEHASYTATMQTIARIYEIGQMFVDDGKRRQAARRIVAKRWPGRRRGA